MFGLLAKPQTQIVVESPGLSSSGLRHFRIGVGSNFSNKATGFLLFDIENVHATKPSIIFRSSDVGSETFGKEASENIANIFLLTDFPSGLFTSSMRFGDPGLGNYRGWTYGSTAALTPTNRKYKIAFTTPHLVEVIRISPNTNNAGLSAANTNAVGTLTIDGYSLVNLKEIFINEIFVSTLNLRLDTLRNLTTFSIYEAANSLTINGKLPRSIKHLLLGGMVGVTNVNDLIANCTECEVFLNGQYAPAPGIANPLTTLTGTLAISHMTKLKELGFVNATSLGAFSLPTVPSNQWRIFQIENCDTAFGGISTSYLDDVLSSSALVYFGIHSNNRSWSKNFSNADISSNLVGMYLYGNQITGDFTITDARTALKDLRLGIATNEQNVFTNIDLSGLNGGALQSLYLDGVLCEDLELPASLPSLTTLEGYDNKLDIATNADLISKINSYTALISLLLGNNSTSQVDAQNFGQDSTNGLGADKDLSALVNLVTLALNKCKISGTWILPNVNKITTLNVSFNPDLVALTNFTSHTSMQTLRAFGCLDLAFSIPNTFTQLNTIDVSQSGVTHIDLSGNTSTAINKFIYCHDCPDLTEIVFPTLATRGRYSNAGIRIYNCPSLSSLVNIENLGFSNLSGSINNSFSAENCALDIVFPFGVNNLLPTTITIQNNGMSSSNVDDTIESIYNNRANWNSFTSSKSMNIAGTNAAPSGTYAAPAGFVLGSNDGTPANANEMVYVLVNNYGWTITTN